MWTCQPENGRNKFYSHAITFYGLNYVDASCKGTSSFMSNTLVIPKQDLLMVYILYRSNKSIGTDE